MVPALRLPRLEAGVAGAEVVLLLVAGAVGDVALAVDAEDLSVGVGNGDAVVIARAVLLEERDGDDDLQLGGQLLQRQNAGVLAHRVRRREPLRVLLGAEIDALEQLRGQHHLRAALGRLAHEGFRLGNVLAQVVAVRGLDGSDGERAVGHLAWLLLGDAVEGAAAGGAAAEQPLRRYADDLVVGEYGLQRRLAPPLASPCRRRGRRPGRWR